MTKQLTVVATSDAFQVWFDRFNEMIVAANTEFMTANTNANGSVTVGNSYLQGIFYADTLSTSSLRGGNVQSTANLSVSSNIVITGTSWLHIGNSSVNVAANSSSISINGNQLTTVQGQINVQTSGTSAQIVDSFGKITFRGAEYVITVKDNGANNILMTKALVFHDSGADAYVSEYGTFFSNNDIASFSANANTTHVRLWVTPTVSNTQVKATRTTVDL